MINLSQKNVVKIARENKDVVDIITFDELVQRFDRIISFL